MGSFSTARLLIFALIALSLRLTLAQYPVKGLCPKKCETRKLNLNPEEMAGKWFLQLEVPYFLDKTYKCASANITLQGNSSAFVNLIYHNSFKKHSEANITTARFTFEPEGMAIVNFSRFNYPLVFQIVGVRFDYIALLACYDCGVFKKKGSGYYSFVFTKARQPNYETLADAMSTLTPCGVPQSGFFLHSQQDCFNNK